MADNLSVKDAAGATKTILMDEVTVESVLGLAQRVKVLNGSTDVSDANPMPVDDAGGSLSVDDNGGSLSVDSTQLPATLGQKTKAASLAVTLASDQGALPISDNGGAITVDSAQLPATLGQKAKAASLPVTLASDEDVIDVNITNVGIPVNDGGGSLTVDNEVLSDAVDRQANSASLSVVPSRSGHTLRYSTAAADNTATDPVRFAKATSTIDTAATATTASMGFANWSGGPTDEVWYFIPMAQYRKALIGLANGLDRNVTVSVYGFLQTSNAPAAQMGTQLLASITGISPLGVLVVGSEEVDAFATDYRKVPSLPMWDYVGLKVQVQTSAPTSGGLTLFVSRDIHR